MNTLYWDFRNNNILSKVGHWRGGVDVTLEGGYSLMNDVMGTMSYMQLIVLNATGKRIEKNIADWIEVFFMGVSYPDSRIWCNQIGALSGDTGCTPAVSAALSILAADSRAYGGSQATFISMSSQKEAYEKYVSGISLAEIVKAYRNRNGKPIIVGFARPVEREDERLKPFERIQKKLDITVGSYLQFAKKMSLHLFENHRLSINCGGYASAFLLDQGFSPMDGYRINAFSVASGAVACHRNLEELPSNSFLPQKCSDIKYTGIARRKIKN